MGPIDINAIIMFAIAFVVSISVHECAHAWMAERLGDPTPRAQGRITLNPAAHLDPIGTILLLSAVIFRVPIMGWGKPVMVNPLNFRDQRQGMALTAAAGPFSNLVMAIISAVMFRLAHPFLPGLLPELLGNIVILNVSLMLFNLIPVHPLDGGKIISYFLPREAAIKFDRVTYQWGFAVLIAMVFVMNYLPANVMGYVRMPLYFISGLLLGIHI